LYSITNLANVTSQPISLLVRHLPRAQLAIFVEIPAVLACSCELLARIADITDITGEAIVRSLEAPVLETIVIVQGAARICAEALPAIIRISESAPASLAAREIAVLA